MRPESTTMTHSGQKRAHTFRKPAPTHNEREALNSTFYFQNRANERDFYGIDEITTLKTKRQNSIFMQPFFGKVKELFLENLAIFQEIWKN